MEDKVLRELVADWAHWRRVARNWEQSWIKTHDLYRKVSVAAWEAVRSGAGSGCHPAVTDLERVLKEASEEDD